MKKLELAIFIATELFGLDSPVHADHWKVKDLMKCNKSTLEDLYVMAEKAKDSRKK